MGNGNEVDFHSAIGSRCEISKLESVNGIGRLLGLYHM